MSDVNKPSFTPGVRRVSPGLTERMFGVWIEDIQIAVCGSEADATLDAAAPDLYEALERYVLADSERDELYKTARAALSKATCCRTRANLINELRVTVQLMRDVAQSSFLNRETMLRERADKLEQALQEAGILV